MIHLNDYTATELQQMIDEGRDIVLGHRENRIHIEFAETELEKELSAKDGVFIASNHTAKVKDYLHIKTKKDGKAYATPSTNSRLATAGILGMTGKQLKALLKKLGGKLIDIKDVPTTLTQKELENMTYHEVQDAARDAGVSIPLNSKKDELITEILRCCNAY